MGKDRVCQAVKWRVQPSPFTTLIQLASMSTAFGEVCSFAAEGQGTGDDAQSAFSRPKRHGKSSSIDPRSRTDMSGRICQASCSTSQGSKISNLRNTHICLEGSPNQLTGRNTGDRNLRQQNQDNQGTMELGPSIFHPLPTMLAWSTDTLVISRQIIRDSHRACARIESSP